MRVFSLDHVDVLLPSQVSVKKRNHVCQQGFLENEGSWNCELLSVWPNLPTHLSTGCWFGGLVDSNALTVARRESRKLPEKTAPVEKEVLRCRFNPVRLLSSPPSCSIKWMLEGFPARHKRQKGKGRQTKGQELPRDAGP